MKTIIASLTLVVSLASFASDDFVVSAICFNKGETKTFQVLIPEASNDFEHIQVGVPTIVAEPTANTPGVIAKIKGDIVSIKLEDGRLLKFNQAGGRNTKLGKEYYICSNALGF